MFDTILESVSQEKKIWYPYTIEHFDLNFSASSAVRPKCAASRDRAGLTSAASNLACDLRSDLHSGYQKMRIIRHIFKNKAHSNS